MTISTIMANKIKKYLISACCVLFWLLVWQAASMIVGIELLLPSPVTVLKRLFTLIQTPEFHLTCLNSSVHILFGFLAALLLGVLLGVGMHFSSLLHALFSPLLKVVRSTPVASFIILALVWMNSTHIPGFISFLMVMPIVCANTVSGLESVSSHLLEVTKVFKFSPIKKLTNLYIPTLIPFIASAAKTGIGLAWKAGVAAEVIAVTANSIGVRLKDAKTYLETTDLFAWTVALIIISILMEAVIGLLASAISKRFNRSFGGDAA